MDSALKWEAKYNKCSDVEWSGLPLALMWELRNAAVRCCTIIIIISDIKAFLHGGAKKELLLSINTLGPGLCQSSDRDSDSDNESECDSFAVACCFKKVVKTSCYTFCGKCKYTPFPPRLNSLKKFLNLNIHSLEMMKYATRLLAFISFEFEFVKVHISFLLCLKKSDFYFTQFIRNLTTNIVWIIFWNLL